jgi:S1-C subfamily serine protease
MKRIAPIIVILTFGLATLACSFGPSITFANPFAPTDTVTVPTPAPIPTVAQPPQPPAAGSSGNPSSTAPVEITGGSAAALDTSLEDLYTRVSPGVVSITILTNQGGAQGSGIVYDKKGHILTNFHVVDGATEIEVDFASGLKVSGEVIGTDLDSDLAIIQVKAPDTELQPLTLGDSDAVKVGETVVALGNPFGLSGTMTYGIVSAKGRTLDSLRQSSTGGFFSSGDIIQTDAAINPGNSGGPLLNLNGEVIGINRAIQTSGTPTTGEPANIGIGFAIPINIIKRVAPVLIASGKYDYPYLGVSFAPDMTLDEINTLGLPQQTGAYIVDVTLGGPGEAAGLLAGTKPTSIQNVNAGGDLVIAVDGRPVKEFNDLIGYVLTNKSPGDKISLSIIRNKQQKEVTLTLGKRP